MGTQVQEFLSLVTVQIQSKSFHLLNYPGFTETKKKEVWADINNDSFSITF